jgi:hypothetical protein
MFFLLHDFIGGLYYDFKKKVEKWRQSKKVTNITIQ